MGGFLKGLGTVLDEFSKTLRLFFAYWMLSFQVLSVVPAGQVATVGHKDERLFAALAAVTPFSMKRKKHIN